MPHFKKIRLKESTSPLLTNPHKGCTTFQRFNGDPLYEKWWSEEGPLTFPEAKQEVAAHYLPTTVAYCRWFWEVLEPEEGKFNWDPIEGALETAHKRGQTLQVRLMAHGSCKQPQVPLWYQKKCKIVQYPNYNSHMLQPDYDSEEFLHYWGRVISEFGRKFDGNPDLETVDIAIVGPWGEGHAGKCSNAQIERFIEIYRKVHPITPLVVNLGGTIESIAYGFGSGTGFRGDCFGEYKYPFGQWDDREKDENGKTIWAYDGIFDAFPRKLYLANGQDVWKHAPVIFEGATPDHCWKKHNADHEFVFRQWYKFHGTYVMAHSLPIPAEYMEPMADVCDRLGYRFVLRQFVNEAEVSLRDTIHYRLWIENTGVAPMYRPYTLKLRFTQGEQREHLTIGPDTRKWLPGDLWLEEDLVLPACFAPGEVMIHAAIVDPSTNQSKVQFANDVKLDNGWFPLGSTTAVC